MTPFDLLLTALGAATLAVWTHLLFGRAFFWLARERDDRKVPPAAAAYPSVCAVVPARDEADVVERSVSSLLAQDYSGPFRLVLVDDQSSDGTADRAREAARALGREEALLVVSGSPPPRGWTGKLWAMAQGVERARAFSPKHVLFTDADIAHAPENLRALVDRAEDKGLVLTSLMAKLNCATLAERALIPAFVFFFDMLYPFPEVNDPRRRRAAAAGGCMLLNLAALDRRGGVAALRTALIDDCALARLMKPEGPIWLGLTERAVSLRPYARFADVGRMVARSAYAQLNYSKRLLAGVVAGLVLTYLAPPLLALLAGGPAQILGAAAWLMMAVSFQPMLAFYRRSPLWGVALPAIGALYALFTVRSAIDVWRGRGGLWKGRAQARMEAA